MSKVLLVEDNTSAVKKIVRYIDNISGQYIAVPTSASDAGAKANPHD